MVSGDSPWGKPPSKNGWIPGTPYDHWKTISYTTFGFHVMWVCECSRCLKPYWSTLTDISYLLDKGKTLTQKSWLEGGYLIVPRCSSCCFSILAMKPGFLCVWIFVVFHELLSHTLPMSESPTTHGSTPWDLWGFRPVYRNTIMREKFVSRPGSRLSLVAGCFWTNSGGCKSRRCIRKPPWFFPKSLQAG